MQRHPRRQHNRVLLPADIASWPSQPLVLAGVDIYASACSIPTMTDKGQKRLLDDTYRAIITVTAATCAPTNGNYQGPKRGGHGDIRPVRRFVAWMARKFIVGEACVVFKALKSLSFDMRQWAVTGITPVRQSYGMPTSFVSWVRTLASTPVRRAQFARLGRLLPEGDQRVCDESMLKFMTTVTERTDTHDLHTSVGMEDTREGFLQRLRGWARGFVCENARHLRRNVDWSPTSGSASLNFSRREGGRYAELLEDSKEVLTPLLPFIPDGTPCALLDETLVETSVEKARVDTWTCKALALPERGYKSRVIVELPAYAQVAGDIIRRQLFPLLEHQEWHDNDDVLNEVSLEQQVRRHMPPEDATILSTDLSNATDRIQHDCVFAFWDGILDGLDGSGLTFPSWVPAYLRKTLGPQRIKVTRKVNGRDHTETVTTTRGIQMGTPLSFFTLNLLHRFALVDAGLATRPMRVRGDDLIAILTPGEIQSYRRRMLAIGFAFNESKTIVSPNGGTFVEETFNVTRKRVGHPLLRCDDRRELATPGVGPWATLSRHIRAREHSPEPISTLGEHLIVQEPSMRYWKYSHHIWNVHRLKDIPLKGLLRSHKKDEGNFLREVGRWVEQVGSKYQLPPRSMAYMGRIVSYAWKPLVRRALAAKVPLHLPIELGGAGIPNRRGRYDLVTGRELRAVIGYAASHPHNEDFLSAVRRLDGGLQEVFTSAFLKRRTERFRYGESEFTYEPHNTETFSACKRTFFLHRWMRGEETSDAGIATESIRERARREMRRLRRPTSIELWYRSLIEKIPTRSSQRGRVRRARTGATVDDGPLGQAPTRTRLLLAASCTEPAAQSQRKFPAVRNQFVPKVQADARRLAERVKAYSGRYVPLTPRVDSDIFRDRTQDVSRVQASTAMLVALG